MGGSAGTGASGGTGGIGGSGGTGGSSGTGGSGGSGGTGTITGSFDLGFKGVKVQTPTSFGVPSPSEGAAARVDIREAPGGYEAVVTPRFGEPAAMTATVTGASVALKGSVTIAGDQGATDQWTSIVIPRAADGSLTDPIQADGQETIFMGDVGETGELTSGGSIGPDATAPEFKASIHSWHGPDNAILPWDTLRVDAAEGVDATALQNNLHVDFAVAAGAGSGGAGSGGNPAQPAVSWSLTPDKTDPTAWAGVVHAQGQFSFWSTWSTDFLVSVDQGVPDPAGHASASYTQMASLLWIGDPQQRIDYGAGAIDYGSWGKVTMLPPGSAACESSGSCARLGTFQNTPCGADRAGVAARLQTGGGTLHVRYRVALGPDYPGDTNPPSWVQTPFSVDTAAPGGAITSTPAQIDVKTLTALPSPDGDLQWTTPWQTLDVPVTANASGEIGYAIYAGVGPGTCVGGPVPPPSDAAVFITSVTVD